MTLALQKVKSGGASSPRLRRTSQLAIPPKASVKAPATAFVETVHGKGNFATLWIGT